MKDVVAMLFKKPEIFAYLLPWLAVYKQWDLGFFQDRLIAYLFGMDVATVLAFPISMVFVVMTTIVMVHLIFVVDVYWAPRVALGFSIICFGCYGLANIAEYIYEQKTLIEGVNIFWGFSSAAIAIVLLKGFCQVEKVRH